MRYVLVATPVLLMGCSSRAEINPNSWKCQQLVDPVIAMSQEEDSIILEITAVEERQNIPGYRLICVANAEWSKGYGRIEFGAHVSDGNKVIVEYKQQ